MAGAAVVDVFGMYVLVNEPGSAQLFQCGAQINGKINGLKPGQGVLFHVFRQVHGVIGQQIDVITNAGILLIHLIAPEFQKIGCILYTIEQQHLIFEIFHLTGVVALGSGLILYRTGIDERSGLGIRCGNGDVLQRKLFAVDSPVTR